MMKAAVYPKKDPESEGPSKSSRSSAKLYQLELWAFLVPIDSKFRMG
jgi:hypothetical protein